MLCRVGGGWSGGRTGLGDKTTISKALWPGSRSVLHEPRGVLGPVEEGRSEKKGRYQQPSFLTTICCFSVEAEAEKSLPEERISVTGGLDKGTGLV